MWSGVSWVGAVIWARGDTDMPLHIGKNESIVSMWAEAQKHCGHVGKRESR